MRLIMSSSFTAAHWAGLLLALMLIAPFVQLVMSERQRDVQRSALIAAAILAIVLVLVTTAQAGVPYNVCPPCLSHYPAWWCEWLYGCK